jgi:hypothetical protein
MPTPTLSSTKAIFDFDNNVRLPALSLKQIYEALGDVPAFAALCGQFGINPRDCERLAGMEISKKRWASALKWVEEGIALEPARDWHNESGYSLKEMKPAILRHLGRKEDALALAWSEFQKHPGVFTYEELMRSVSRDQRPKWHERAMAEAAGAGLSEFISLCVKTRKALAEFVRKAHSRKSGFMADFEQVVSGKCGRSPSFAEQAHEQWERLTS